MLRSAPAVLVLAVLALSGCTEPAQAPAEGADSAAAPAPARTRPLTIKGSDTMVILGQRWAEKYMAGHPGSTVQVTGGGSGTGIAALINGTTDIAQASRPMKDAEKKQLQEKRGAPAVEHKVAMDGLAIYAHKDNPVQALTLGQLEKIYTGQLKSWKDVGGPDRPIVLYGRENNSGTYAYFKEHVLKEADFAADTQTLPGTAAVVNAVSRDPNAIGYGGIAYETGVRTVPVKKDDASAPVEATLETVSNGSYPISRYLFMYTTGEPTGAAKDFLAYALSDEGQKIASEVGYYPLPKAQPAAAPAADAPPAADPGKAAGAAGAAR